MTNPTKQQKCVRCANGDTRTADGFHLMSTGRYKRCADLPPYEENTPQAAGADAAHQRDFSSDGSPGASHGAPLLTSNKRSFERVPITPANMPTLADYDAALVEIERLRAALATETSARVELAAEIARLYSSPDETAEKPVAWRHLVDSPYEKHPRWHYTEDRPAEEPERFEALYARPSQVETGRESLPMAETHINRNGNAIHNGSISDCAVCSEKAEAHPVGRCPNGCGPLLDRDGIQSCPVCQFFT